SVRSLPRVHTNALPVAGSTSSSLRPRATASARACGTRARNVSGPSSTGTPPSDEVRILPPSRSSASRTVTRARSRRNQAVAGAGRALPGGGPPGVGDPHGHVDSRLPHLARVRVARRLDEGGQAVGGEDHLDVGLLVAQARDRRPHEAGQQVEVAGGGMPRV